MQITLKARSRRVKQKVEKDYQWYDHQSRTMLYGKGGEMRFQYRDGKSIPYLVDQYDWVWKNDYEELSKWVKQNRNKVSVIDCAPGHYILIDVNDNNISDIEDDLMRNGIMYD